MIIGDMSVGSFIRDPSNAKKIMVIKEKRQSSSVLVWGYDSINKVEKSNEFRFLPWDNVVEQVSI